MTQQQALKNSEADAQVATGIQGLDEVLNGGLTANRIYLVEGSPGSGKTTLGLQFLLEGARRGQKALYITLSETAAELKSVGASHGWSLDELAIHELVSEDGLEPEAEQSVLHPSEVELGETVNDVMNKVRSIQPDRVVFDSLSEMRLLSQNALRYRRQVLALKQFLVNKGCTVLLLDDKTSEPGDLQLHSICHGVISLDQVLQEYGSERRRLRIAKMRGIDFRRGMHDFDLGHGGITVYPRLIAAEHHRAFSNKAASTGVAELDTLLGGGLVPGTNTLLIGPSGVGKTTTNTRCVLTALERGEKAVYFLFDETLATMLTRSKLLGMNLEPHIESGRLTIQQIDPAEMTPGQFSSRLRIAVEQHGVTMVVIDSLNAYLQSMPGQRYLLLQMHELLSYLNQQGVTTLIALGQHGLIGNVESEIDLSYLSDSIILFRFFESTGKVLSAISVLKSRTSAHERTVREFQVGVNGVQVGAPLSDFEGVLAGLPKYSGDVPLLDPQVRAE
ncbi:circadian clock protein KaiC [Burkholderia sp. Leaf177]|uniref:ATPase domain-containing protein n=1 Tax=Burkholderia sp. Leaf177 TaxID=1736287 RepID=UPI0006F4FCFA|nr:ATPase domain-containing protein [Burkholderia sp. Leaf177]KQR76880.1 circadian clock protein KaiC [Burkholderia sp. Leaf177]